VVLIPIVLALMLRAPVPVLAVVAGAVALLTVQEFLKLTESYGVQPMRLPTYIFSDCFFCCWRSIRGTKASALDRDLCLQRGIRGGHCSVYFSDHRHAQGRSAQRISGSGRGRVCLHLHCAAHGNAGAVAPAVGGSVLLLYLLLVVWAGDISPTSWASRSDGI
jgi:CDP-diglyceride synthetase